MIHPKIKSIAQKCRTICEQFAHSLDSVDYDFHRAEDLHCMCAVASFFINKVATKEGLNLNCRKVESSSMGHVFNEYNGIAIDITATQFGSEKPVHIQRLDEYEQFIDLGKSKICKRVDWGTGQNPSKKVVDKLMKMYYGEE